MSNVKQLQLTLMRLCALVLAAAAFATHAQPNMPVESRIVIAETDASFVITVPLSRIAMTVPKGRFRVVPNNVGGSTSSPRYFFLASQDARLSGWFEPDQQQSDLERSWRTEMESLASKGFGPPSDVERLEVAGRQSIIYTLPVPSGTTYHLRAFYIDAGTWVDFHLSTSSSQANAEAREKLLELARSISFAVKP